MSAAPSRRRSLLQRPLLLFGCLLLVPALGFSWLGWESLDREREGLARDRARATREALEAQTRAAADSLERLKQRESQRPYYEYQAEVLLTDAHGENLLAQASALTRAPEDSRLLGWFQWEAGPKGAFPAPELFGPEAAWGLRGLVEGYGDALRTRLEGAATDAELRSGRVEDVPLSLVQANEERGQLLEELEVSRQQQALNARPPAENGNPSQSGVPNVAPQTPYLTGFMRRAGAEPVHVRYTRIQHLVRAEGAPGPPLVAWRLVWIPAAHAERREVARDRWLLQGYALDPARGAAAGWSPVGPAQVAWEQRVPPAEAAERGVVRSSLAAALHAEPAVPGATLDLALALVARPDEEAARTAWADARRRFLLLVGALVFVVALGFVVLLRGVRKEVALARRKEDFVAAVTHELKTPLTGIRMYAEMLEQGWVADADAAQDHARRIIEECGRLGHLVDQVLDLAALERGIAGPNLGRGDLGSAVAAAVGLLRSRAEQAGVPLHLAIEGDLPPIPFDPRLLRPLVLNLVENAIKYSERAPVKHVEVALARSGERLVLTVKDRGVGIAPEAQRSLFQPFHRGGDEMTRAAPGVGIGLALVKRYAEVHRAKVHLESVPGAGTTVTVRFPI
jgi:signal transduction histidine kinase